MVKATVERMVKGNADALDKNGRAEKKIAREQRRGDRSSDWCKSRRLPDSTQSFSTAIASQRLRSNRRAADNAAFAAAGRMCSVENRCSHQHKSSPNSFRAPYSEAVNQNHLPMPTTLWVRTLALLSGPTALAAVSAGRCGSIFNDRRVISGIVHVRRLAPS